MGTLGGMLCTLGGALGGTLGGVLGGTLGGALGTLGTLERYIGRYVEYIGRCIGRYGGRYIEYIGEVCWEVLRVCWRGALGALERCVRFIVEVCWVS